MYLKASNRPASIARVNLVIESFLNLVSELAIYLLYIGALLILLDVGVFRKIVPQEEVVTPTLNTQKRGSPSPFFIKFLAVLSNASIDSI